MPSGNPEYVVIYSNYGAYLIYLVGVYIPLGNPEHVVFYAIHGIYLYKTDQYNDLPKHQPVLDFLIVCKQLKHKAYLLHDLYKSQHVLDFLIVCKQLKNKTYVFHDMLLL
jgi:hypothetical protein